MAEAVVVAATAVVAMGAGAAAATVDWKVAPLAAVRVEVSQEGSTAEVVGCTMLSHQRR